MRKTKARLYVDDDLTEGARLVLSGAAAHYLATVMRAEPGDAVALFNGRDGEWLAQVAEAGRKRVELDVGARTRAQAAEPDLWLCFAPLKKTATDFVVEKACELGVARILPVLTRRTVAARVNVERLRATAREAAEQCERLTLPEVAEPLSLERLIADWSTERSLLYMDESGGGAPISEVLGASSADGVHALLTGPEGGFEPAELDALRILSSAVAVGLGPRILRAETAAVAALACWQALRGDWRDGPRGTT